jgi:DNA polymerase III delta prime subunit
MQNITGNPVDGEDFFGRKDELKQLRNAVEAGNHVLLVGPRRVGKSSLVAELSRELANDGWSPIKVDVQHTADEAAFLYEIHFGHWDSRLGDLLDDNGEEAKARLLLDHLCSHATGRTREQLRSVLAKAHPQADPAKLERDLRDILDFLERDGYLGRIEDRYAFRSFLLRDYWHRRFGE